MMILATQTTDPYRNLAIEEWLLAHAPRLPLLLLYRNAPCVVIGKNQNPWRECRLSRMEQDGVALARRISGGGTVYHDEGNLNFSVITARTRYHEEKQYELIFRALDCFGIRAERFNKSSLAVDGRKFSGQAFCFRGAAVLHHGTLLVQSDLDRLQRYLGPEVEGIETRAVESIPWKVMNLSEAVPGLTVERLADVVIAEFCRLYRDDAESGDSGLEVAQQAGEVVESGEVDALARVHAAPEWLFGRTPKFEMATADGRLRVVKGSVPDQNDLPFAEWLSANHRIGGL